MTFISITPTYQSVPLFDYNEVDAQIEYQPPLLPGISEPQTEYVWNLDQQLKEIIRPDGQTVLFNYHGSQGRLESVSWPNGTRTVGYDDKAR